MRVIECNGGVSLLTIEVDFSIEASVRSSITFSLKLSPWVENEG